MKTIKVRGTTEPALVDDEDYPVLSRLAWHVEKTSGQLVTRICKEGEHALRMHRLLKPYKINYKLIYGDGNALNNQKDNLIYKNLSELQQLASKAEHCVSKYKGVRYRSDRKAGKNWVLGYSKIISIIFLDTMRQKWKLLLPITMLPKNSTVKDAFLNDVKQPTATSNQVEDESI